MGGLPVEATTISAFMALLQHRNLKPKTPQSPHRIGDFSSLFKSSLILEKG
jgi:hypothetical protein